MKLIGFLLSVLASMTWVLGQVPPEVYNQTYSGGKTIYSQVLSAEDMAYAARGGSPTNELILWLQADRIPNATEGAIVATWPDLGPGHHDATATIPTHEPTFRTTGFKGAYPSVHFDYNGNQLLDTLLPLTTSNMSYSVFVVFQSAGMVGTSPSAILGPINNAMDAAEVNIGPAPLLFIQDLLPTKIIGEIWGAAAVPVSPYELNSPSLTTLTFDARSSQLLLYLNGRTESGTQPAGKSVSGGQQAVGNVSGYQTPVSLSEIPAVNVWRIGNHAKLRAALEGDIAEIRIYAGVLPALARASVENELAAKYKLDLPTRRVIWSDNFDATDSTDLNTGLTGRQTGLMAPRPLSPRLISAIPYSSFPGQIKNNALVVTNMAGGNPGSGTISLISPDLDFHGLEVNDSFRIQVDLAVGTGLNPSAIDPLVLATTTAGQPAIQTPLAKDTSFASIKFRADKLKCSSTEPSGVALVLLENGTFSVKDGTRNIFTGTVPSSPNYAIDIQVENNVATIFVNGIPLANGGSSQIQLNAAVANYVTLEYGAPANNVQPGGVFDNFVFSVPVAAREESAILTDHFNIPDDTDFNRDLAARQSGAAAPASYLASSPEKISIHDSVLEFKPEAGTAAEIVQVSPGLDMRPYESAAGFVARADLTPDATGWAALTLAGTMPLRGGTEIDGLQIRVRANGEVVIYNDGEVISTNLLSAAAIQHVEAVVRNQFALEGESISIATVTVNNQPLLFPGSKTEYALMNRTNHFVTLSGAGNLVKVDNLWLGTIGSATPKLQIQPIDLQNFKLTWTDAKQQFSLVTRTNLADSWQSSELQVTFDPTSGLSTAIATNADEARFFLLRSP